MVNRRHLLKLSALATASLATPMVQSSNKVVDEEFSPDQPVKITDLVAGETKTKLVEDDSLRQEVANISDPDKGAGMIGVDGRRLRDYLKQQEYYLTIEYFGLTDTPANTKATMQTAINFCAANGILLRRKALEYTIDVSESSITIPNNFMCNFDGAWIRRAPGNKTPHDMWINADINNGNCGLDIRGVCFDGNAHVDRLDNRIVTHRFCGLRLIKCEGKLTDVRSDATCNGEIQAEGTRGGILLQNSVFMECRNLRTDNTIGTGLFITGGNGSLYGFIGNNNSGSGLSGDQGGWQLSSLRSVGSGYSGISLNGPGFKARDIYATRAAIGFAGVNFGHARTGSEGADAIASDVMAENNFGWGINVNNCPGLQGENWVSKNSGSENIRLINSPGSKISLSAKGGGSHGLLVDGVGHYDITARISGARLNGVYARNGADVTLSPGSLLSDNSTGGGFAAGVTAGAKARVEVYCKVLNGIAFGVQSVKDGVIVLNGSNVVGNAAGNVRAAGGVVTYTNAKFGSDSMSGEFTIPAGSNSVLVANGNAIDQNRLVFTPANSAAIASGAVIVEEVLPSSGFVARIAANASADAIYRYIIL